MSRIMYDGEGAFAAEIAKNFPHATVIAGYANGSKSIWSAADWDHFPHAGHVVISVLASADVGDVLDVETGDAEARDVGSWIAKRKASGYHRPTIYTVKSKISEVRKGSGRYVLGRDYDIWIADPTGKPHEFTVPGTRITCPVVQYYWDKGGKGYYDASVIYDSGWPHRKA